MKIFNFLQGLSGFRKSPLCGDQKLSLNLSSLWTCLVVCAQLARTLEPKRGFKQVWKRFHSSKRHKSRGKVPSTSWENFKHKRCYDFQDIDQKGRRIRVQTTTTRSCRAERRQLSRRIGVAAVKGPTRTSWENFKHKRCCDFQNIEQRVEKSK